MPKYYVFTTETLHNLIIYTLRAGDPAFKHFLFVLIFF